LAVALDTLEAALTEVIEKIETGGLDQLDATEKVALWRRFETFRNRLPLIDHSLIADAEATDLPATSCSSSLTGFWCRCCNSPPVRQPPESALQQPWAPHLNVWGEKLEPVLPHLAALQREGALSTEKYRLWNGPCRNSPGPD
jgi:hypothetical protein